MVQQIRFTLQRTHHWALLPHAIATHIRDAQNTTVVYSTPKHCKVQTMPEGHLN